MDEYIYSLLLKSTQGVALLGTLRYTTDFTSAASDAEADGEAQDRQQQTTIGGVIFSTSGSLTIPLLTGVIAVPLSGQSIRIFMGESLVTQLSGSDLVRPLQLQFNPIDFERIAGGVVWRPGATTRQVFSFLGRRLASPA